jgi:mevalonate kinase
MNMADLDEIMADAQYDEAMSYWQQELEAKYQVSKEDFQKLIEIVHKNHDELMDMIRTQNVLLKQIFRLVNETNEEYRIDHPKFSMLVKMAEEWGLEDGKEDE